MLGDLSLMQVKHEQAFVEGKQAIVLAPNNATSHAILAERVFYAGRFEEAIVLIENESRLHPYCPA